MPAFLDFPDSTVGGGGAASSDWDGLEFNLAGNSPSQTIGTITFTAESDGTWNCPVPRVFGVETGHWFTPATPGIGSQYEGRFSYTGLDGYAESSVSNDAASWESLGSGLSFTFSLSGSFAFDTGEVLFEVRDKDSLVVVASGTFLPSIALT